jgi:hypothetical protein
LPGHAASARRLVVPLRPWLGAAAAGLAAAAVAVQVGVPVGAGTLAALRMAVGFGWLGVALVAAVQAVRSFGVRRHSVEQLSWTATLRRGMAVSLVALPRFVLAGDVPGFVVASFWLTALLACGFVYVEPALGRRASWFWWGALMLVAPWGSGPLSAHWPPFA